MKKTSKRTECLTCKSLRGEIKLAPGPIIHDGRYWRIEHVAPTAVMGWLVIILKRHAGALHELSTKEFSEFAILSKVSTTLLFKKFKCEKEYMACFAEGEGFHHVHVHIIPKPTGLPPTYMGPQIFQLLGPKVTNPIKDEEIEKNCLELKRLFEMELSEKI